MFKVMIVDDIEVMRRQIKRLPLWGESTGFNIIDEAEDGQEALCKLQSQPVDLLITDIKMPRINGIELLKEVNENSLATCVVFLSEHSEFNFAKEAIQYGIFDYLVKPVKADELENLLQKVKNYIEEQEKAKTQLKKLEEKLMEKMDVYYPTGHINSIVQYILYGNKKGTEVIESMVEDTAAALGYDTMKTAIVLQRAYNEILINIKESHGWIEEFIDITSFDDINLTKYEDIDSIKKKMKEVLETIKLIIDRFIIDSNKTPLIKEICIYVLRNVEKDISITKISEVLFLTKNHIGDIFKQETGMTLGEYITMVKIERAKQLVIEGDLKNYEIAQNLGYRDVEYFGKLFKKNTGLTPMEYRNTVKNR